jgi:hypothetical protein
MHKHATVSAWQRAEDGSYKAELHGWRLEVRWRPEQPDGGRRGFLWKAKGPLGRKAAAHEVEEEIEVAMAHAEEYVAGAGDPPS